MQQMIERIKKLILENKELFERVDSEYNQYLEQHIGNVQKGYDWLKDNLPEVLSEYNYLEEIRYYGELDEIISNHDRSKYNDTPDADNYYDLTMEYDEYDNYFYGEKTDEVKEKFDHAWLAHIHANPHHWQHWLLQNDDPKIGMRVLDIPYVFCVEMICDWWAFSWKSGNLYEIFDWYDKNKKGIILSDKSRTTVETILDKLRTKLDENA